MRPPHEAMQNSGHIALLQDKLAAVTFAIKKLRATLEPSMHMSAHNPGP